jgi:CBS domain-containing protein
MTCRDIMTENPTCCTASDSAARAAEIMRSEDVGPVPVVNDHSTKHLVGIVTDRDLAIKVIAEGLNPNSVTLNDIMSRDLVTCGPSDSLDDAMAAMADHQVRRIPIVDDNRRVIGIIAQADLARCVDEQTVGDVVEEISEPGGFGFRFFGGRRYSGSDSEYDQSYGSAEASRSSAASTLLPAMIGIGLGAGLMYLLDPNSGRRRRAKARDKAYSWSKTAAEEANRKARHIGNRAAGLMAEARSTFAKKDDDATAGVPESAEQVPAYDQR